MRDRRDYFQRYYREKIKPYRTVKPPMVMVGCPFCGMLNYPPKYESGIKDISVKYRFGCRYEDALEKGGKAAEFALTYVERVVNDVMNGCLSFLDFCLGRGLIEKKDIASHFDIEIESPVSTIESARSLSSMREVPLLKSMESPSFNLVKQLKPVEVLR